MQFWTLILGSLTMALIGLTDVPTADDCKALACFGALLALHEDMWP